MRATHSETVLDEVARVLERAGRRPNELERIVVGAGPGSFTGVRIASALGKGLRHALDLPLFAYSSLRTVAASAGIAPLCALFDARRDEVYAAAYEDPAGAPIFEPAVAPIDESLSRVEALGCRTFAGEGAIRHRPEIEVRGGKVLAAHLGVPRASALLWLADRLPAGRVEDPGPWEPGYVRASGAERQAAGHA